jgi:hypothetical protein
MYLRARLSHPYGFDNIDALSPNSISESIDLLRYSNRLRSGSKKTFEKNRFLARRYSPRETVSRASVLLRLIFPGIKFGIYSAGLECAKILCVASL